MSWLYTMVFAGLMFSSQETVPPDLCTLNTPGEVIVETVADESEKFAQTYPLTANGRVHVSNVNGSITIEGWERNEVKLEYTKTADTRERLADVDVHIDSRPDHFSVEADYDNWKNNRSGDRWRGGGKLTVEFRLMVPRGAVLNEAETVNGSVTASNFTNVTRISAVNGAVKASNIRGTANLSTVNGEVAADFDRLEPGSKIMLETVNGRVNLLIPSDANATVKADSLNGNISNDFGLPVRKGKYVGRDLYGRIGSGDVQIKLNSVNGALSIGRRSDGRSVSPATDLLPQKEKDEDDWDNDIDIDIDKDDDEGMINSAKLDKQVAKAAREGAKAARATAAIEAQVNKITPEIEKITAESIGRTAEAIRQGAEILNAEEMQRSIAEARMRQDQALARIAEAGFISSLQRVEKKSNSFPVKGVPNVTVDAKGCSVTIRGWDKNEVQYKVTQFSDTRNRTPMNIKEEKSDSSVDLKVMVPHDARRRAGEPFTLGGSVKIDVFVPRRSNLKVNADGEIRLEGVSGNVELTGSDESINVRDADGSLRVSSSDGRVRVIGFKGELDAATSEGMINLEGDFTRLTARATDGNITLTLPENAAANLEASCSDVAGEGISVERLSMTDTVSRYRIGKGGVPFKIETSGEIRVRGSSVLKNSF